MKFASIIFRALQAQTIAQAEQENMLATYTDFKFVERLRPVITELSKTNTRTYISYLLEAQEMILQGESKENVYEQFFVRLAKLKQEDKQ